ncbi:phosphofructokinase [Aureimonas sp. OT7]|uniref:1-phosphofructokinase family hexose kinase n=1 Tax=Aureimonas TaxID=414371 RepID=UPI00177D2EAC|nr:MULTISPECIES: PfkB family carbohydrate kinase [Aureimonas]QOG06509.1 phosphofructokinase [Aureimonas sp. OT7]
MPSDKVARKREASAEIAVFAPWPLFTITIEKLASGEDEVYFHAGGQGVWAARMAAELGGKALLIGPVGGEARTLIEALVRAEGLDMRAVPIRHANGGYINDRRGGQRKEIATVPPPRLDRHEVDDLYNAALAEGIRCGTMIVTGVPDGKVLPVEVYTRLSRDLRANDVISVADIAGTVLDAVEEGLTLIKVSHEELQAAGLAKDDSRKSLMKAMEGLRKKADNIVVSCAGAGALALMQDRFWEAKAPQLTPRDHSGAGDSMTAALAVALSRGDEPDACLKLATAAGAMNVTRHGRGTGNLHDIEIVAGRVEIEELK